MSASEIGFLALALLAVIGAAGVVLIDNPVRSALCLVLNFFVLGFIYFTLGAPMIGITQIMVYAGAIMVLFLFVIMMLKRQGAMAKPDKPDSRLGLAVVLGLALAVTVYATVIAPQGVTLPLGIKDYGTPQAVGVSLFTNFVWPFEVVSVLLLVGIVGSIMLAKRRI
ncbi:MAG: NADH-quinone oxidoreductase subunit J [Armatimonadetes bacterium]|nr:NADH-quinone oxidoreductase subunit J [Armatimonadota bacterium]